MQALFPCQWPISTHWAWTTMSLFRTSQLDAARKLKPVVFNWFLKYCVPITVCIMPLREYMWVFRIALDIYHCHVGYYRCRSFIVDDLFLMCPYWFKKWMNQPKKFDFLMIILQYDIQQNSAKCNDCNDYTNTYISYRHSLYEAGCLTSYWNKSL